MKPLLSVIIPVYKVEPYLKKCVDSVLDQTYENLEIILVDDGSPDRCGRICDQLSQQDKRVRVIHKANGGLSSARNAGLDIARGDLIAFVDSDDWLEGTTIYEEIVDEFRKDCALDFVQFPIVQVYSSGSTKSITVIDNSIIYGNKLQACMNFTPNVNSPAPGQITVASWDKVYRRALISYTRFKEGYIFEDTFFIIELLEKCNRVLLKSMEGYYAYYMRDGSITHSANYNKLTNDCWMERTVSMFNFHHKYDNIDAEIMLKHRYLTDAVLKGYNLDDIERLRLKWGVPKSSKNMVRKLTMRMLGSKGYARLLQEIFKIRKIL